MAAFLRSAFAGCSLPAKILLPILFVLWAYYTSRGYMVPDMDLYHGQSIRWIEEYGVVKGLGNLHNRFGYNSSIFALSALFSMKFMVGKSLHAVNGLLAFIMTVEALKLGRVVKRRKMLLSDYARVGLVYYMSNILDEILAPSSDYPVMFAIFFIVIKWLALLEQEDETERNQIAPYGLLCVMGVHALTLKVTAGLILILLIKPAYLLLKEKRWMEIGIFLAMGLAVALPWLARNVIITGWLLYPFPALDLFNVDWKMTDVGLIRSDAAEIEIYAKGHPEKGLNATLTEWFPGWFKGELYSLEKVFVLADIVSVPIVAFIVVRMLVKREWKQLDISLVFATVMANYLFWQFSAPMMRYGYAHVLLLAMLVFGYLLESIDKLWLKRIAYCGLALFLVYRTYMLYDVIRSGWWTPHYVWQETYREHPVESYEIDGVTVYFSIDEGLSGYEPFPSGPEQKLGIELRGEGLKDGFRPKLSVD